MHEGEEQKNSAYSCGKELANHGRQVIERTLSFLEVEWERLLGFDQKSDMK